MFLSRSLSLTLFPFFSLLVVFVHAHPWIAAFFESSATIRYLVRGFIFQGLSLLAVRNRFLTDCRFGPDRIPKQRTQPHRALLVSLRLAARYRILLNTLKRIVRKHFLLVQPSRYAVLTLFRLPILSFLSHLCKGLAHIPNRIEVTALSIGVAFMAIPYILSAIAINSQIFN